jgi:hypothetical protein
LACPNLAERRVVSLPTGMDPRTHSDVFAHYELGVLEIERRVDDIRNFTHPSQGMKLRQLCMITLSVSLYLNPRPVSRRFG